MKKPAGAKIPAVFFCYKPLNQQSNNKNYVKNSVILTFLEELFLFLSDKTATI